MGPGPFPAPETGSDTGGNLPACEIFRKQTADPQNRKKSHCEPTLIPGPRPSAPIAPLPKPKLPDHFTGASETGLVASRTLLPLPGAIELSSQVRRLTANGQPPIAQSL